MLPWRAILLAGLLLPLCQAAQAPDATRDFIVAPGGSDSAPGSADSPWLTLQHAADSVRGGDTVLVLPGEYAGFFLGNKSARGKAPGAATTFRAEPGAIIVSRSRRSPDGINLEGASDIVIEGFTINNADGSITRAGIRSVQNHGVVILNNTTDRCGTWGIFTGFSDRVRIENNVASRAQKQHGIYVSNSTDRPIVRGNTLFLNRGCGLHMNGDLSQGAPGMITGAIVENNIIHDNGAAGGSGINCDGVRDSRIANNLLYNNHAAGISLYRTDGALPSSGNVVVNNTVIMPRDARWAMNIRDGAIGNAIYNNIFYDQNAAHGAISISGDSLSGLSCDFNAIDGRFSIDGGVMKLPGWRAATARDQHSFIATPAELFIDVADNNYRPAAGSPAIGRGTNLPRAGADASRPVVSPDIGANLPPNPETSSVAPEEK